MGIYAVPSALASHNRGTAIPACPVAVWPNQPQSSRKWNETFAFGPHYAKSPGTCAASGSHARDGFGALGTSPRTGISAVRYSCDSDCRELPDCGSVTEPLHGSQMAETSLSAAPGRSGLFLAEDVSTDVAGQQDTVLRAGRSGAVYAGPYHAPWDPRLASRAASA